jgi:hypothetical protein
MGMDEYSMALYVKQLLEDARAAAARRALAAAVRSASAVRRAA